ncbi:NAD(P)H-dependent oxidoreductase [Vibrio viridaestus]|uniref:Flavodoxin family protein n=1 Tax=Vibrio viridaestus TaxID=2487322 RepID=A0A3N9U847_9VIBR|nr:NAD(P)H-dependent oxidoreductase [Vibrio viridaestus]RQW64366.1 flavodoxin family protein [Vibrio viridaestus]
MNVLVVYAHPEPTSLNGAIKLEIVKHLQSLRHDVKVSDLYAMNWKAVLNEQDRTDKDPSTPFHPSEDSREAFVNGTQSADITQEQEKLLWADLVIFQFPLWWFSMPAIMKGWFERVYAFGFAYGYGEHSDTHWGDRYGEGKLSGKKAMLVITAGGWESHYSGRGINGPIEDLLFPIHHGMLFYPGMEVLPPVVVYKTHKMDDDGFSHLSDELLHRLRQVDTVDPIPFRRQNLGDYSIPELTLKSDITPETVGFSAHLQD